MAKLKGGSRNQPASHSRTAAPMAGPSSLPVHSENGVLFRHLKVLEDDPFFFNRTTERLYVFNKDGSLDFTQSQHAIASVSLTDYENYRLKDKVLLHNHPSGNAFSIGDVMVSREYDAYEMRATGKFGTFIIRRPSGGWPSETTMVNELGSHLNGLSPRISDTTLKAWGEFAKSIGSDFVFVKRSFY